MGDLVDLAAIVQSGGDSTPVLRPPLPEVRPTQAEILADGVVTDDEYELAFWTFVECAETAGVEFVSIIRERNGQYSYTTGGGGDDCSEAHFQRVDMTWQLANE